MAAATAADAARSLASDGAMIARPWEAAASRAMRRDAPVFVPTQVAIKDQTDDVRAPVASGGEREDEYSLRRPGEAAHGEVGAWGLGRTLPAASGCPQRSCAGGVATTMDGERDPFDDVEEGADPSEMGMRASDPDDQSDGQPGQSSTGIGVTASDAAGPPDTLFRLNSGTERKMGLLAKRSQPVTGGLAAREIVTLNATSHGPLVQHLSSLTKGGSPVAVVIVQEHRALNYKLGEVQAAALDAGWAGAWLPAAATTGGSSGGVAVLARSNIVVSYGPNTTDGCIVPARILAAHVHWGLRGGLVCVSAYFIVGDTNWAENLALLWEAVQYIKKVEIQGHTWMLAGDFNAEPEQVFNADMLQKMGARLLASEQPTCVQTAPGRCIDYFVVPADLAPRLTAPRVDEGADTWPHHPVHIGLQGAAHEAWARTLCSPKAVPPDPRPGCARPPWRWPQAMQSVQAVRTQEQLQVAWDIVMWGIEEEILGRYDIVDEAKRPFYSAGKGVDCKWQKVDWKPPMKRSRVGERAKAHAVARKWLRHLQAVRDALAKWRAKLEGSHGPVQAARAQETLAKLATESAGFCANIAHRHDVYKHLDPDVHAFFQLGEAAMSSDVLDAMARKLEEQAAALTKKDVAVAHADWHRWAEKAMLGGARQGHQYVKGRDPLETVRYMPDAQPHALADAELRKWEGIWKTHQQELLPLPPEAHAWPQLPPITAELLRRVVSTYPARTASGHTKLPPRALRCLSDEALCTLGALLMKAEKLGGWPSDRLVCLLARIPKPDGGARVIGLQNTILRIWGRARKPVTDQWLRDHEMGSNHTWGTRKGYSSVDSAFDHNLVAEIAKALGHGSITLCIDIWKCFEMVCPSILMFEGAQVGFPPRLLWMMICTYQQPRRIQAYGNVSVAIQSGQGVIAGCTHATTALVVLTKRAMTRASDPTNGVRPRQLVDDIGIQKICYSDRDVRCMAQVSQVLMQDLVDLKLPVQPKKMGFVATAARLKRQFAPFAARIQVKFKRWMRNLGHELSATRPRRYQERARLNVLKSRKRRIVSLAKTVGRKIVKLQLTGLAPMALHGAAVSGVSNEALRQARTSAGVLAGARPAASLTLTLMMQPQQHCDPVYTASQVVVQYAQWLWEARSALASLQAAWQVINATLSTNASWANARGPIAAVWLTLHRLDWRMVSAHGLLDDGGRPICLLTCSPKVVKHLLYQGIQRWQARQVQAHHPQWNGEQLWVRAMRATLKGRDAVGSAKQRGALQCLWAGAMWPRAQRHERGLTPDAVCQCCGAARETHGHRWYPCPGLTRHAEGEPTDLPAIPEQLQATRARLQGQASLRDGEPDYDTFELALCIPVAPEARHLPPRMATEVRSWGMDDAVWSGTVYTDAGSLFAKVPEAQEISWAMVQLSDDGFPIRARYGIMPGPVRTVPRGERYAALQAVRAGPGVDMVVSDHLSLVSEGNEWREADAAAGGTHADLWRKMRNAVAARPQHCRRPPAFTWVPSHKTPEEAAECDLDGMHWIGNFWADVFATLAITEHQPPDSYGRNLELLFAAALQTARFGAWAASRVAQVGAWDPPPDEPRAPRRQRAGPQLHIIQHEYVAVGSSSDGVMCLRCGRLAHTAHARRRLDATACDATRLGCLRAVAATGLDVAARGAAAPPNTLFPHVEKGGPAAQPDDLAAARTTDEKVQYLLRAAGGPERRSCGREPAGPLEALGGAAEDDMEAAKGACWAARAPRPRPKSAGGAPARGAPGPVGDGCRGRVARRWPERWQCSQCWEPRGAWWACGGAWRDDEAGAGAPGGCGNCAGGGRLRTQARA